LKTNTLAAWQKWPLLEKAGGDLPVSQDAQQRVCDWHASHYVKVMLDQIFGENNFQNANLRE
jgi:hypothetical protein